MDAAAMQEVFEIRSALEGLAVRLALPHIRAREIKRLERLLEDMDDCHAEPAEWIERHHAFHEYLCSLADRPRLLRQINGLHTLIEPHMRLWLAHVGNPHLADDEHRAIIAALRNGDPTAATKVICEHIEGTVPELLRFIERAKGPNA
jgi:DNA-binding GntR family transcriptional regulator